MTIRLPFQWLLLAAVILGVFYPAIFGGLNPADDVRLVNWLSNLETFDVYSLFFLRGSYYYRPVPFVTFYLDQMLWDTSSLFMHVENILIHLFNASLVFIIARRMCREASHLPNWLPLLMAMVFALHPVNAEAVCWISGRYDLLATSFVLMSTWLLLCLSPGESNWYLIPPVLLALLGCLSKEPALFFFGGAVLILYVHCRKRANSSINALRALIPGFLIWCIGALSYLLFRYIALSGRDTGIKTVVNAAVTQEGFLDWANQFRIAVKVIGFYLKKIFFPYPLNFSIIEVSDIYLFVGSLLLVLSAWLLWRVWHADLAAAFFLGSLLTCSAALLVVFGNMAWTPVAERYLYMPTSLFVLGWTAWASKCHGLRFIKAFKVLAVCFLIASGGMTIQRALLWNDPVAFAEDTVAKSPNFMPARKDLANYYLALGRVEEGKQLLKGLQGQAETVGYINFDLSMAAQLVNEGQFEAAHQILEKTLASPGKQFDEVAKAVINVNHKRLNDKDIDVQLKVDIRRENVRLFEQLKEQHNDPFTVYQLAKEYLALGDIDLARTSFEDAYRRAPSSSFYRQPAKKLAERLAAR